MRVVWWLCLATVAAGLPRTARSDVVGRMDASTAHRILVDVSARDHEWYRVLSHTVAVNRDELDALSMPDANGPAGDYANAGRIVSHLVRHYSTDSQTRFGVRVIGKALSCQFMCTLQSHLFATHKNGKKKSTNVPALRANLSKIQAALPGYVAKLVYFGQDVADYVAVNDTMNAVFASHDADPAVKKAVFMECLSKAYKRIMDRLNENCALNDPDAIRGHVNAADTRQHQENTAVIDYLDRYEFAGVTTGREVDVFKELLNVEPYEYKEPSLHGGNDDG